MDKLHKQFPSLNSSTPQPADSKPNFPQYAIFWSMFFNRADSSSNLSNLSNIWHNQTYISEATPFAEYNAKNRPISTVLPKLSSSPKLTESTDTKESPKPLASVQNNSDVEEPQGQCAIEEGERNILNGQESGTISMRSKKIRKRKYPKEDNGVPSRQMSKKDLTKKVLWTAEDDIQLLQLYNTHGPRWATIAQIMLNRTRKQVRDRYLNCLRPDINRGEWTEEEDELFTLLYKKLGKKWCEIATYLPGRTENQVKNRYYWGKKNYDQSVKNCKKEHLSMSIAEIVERFKLENKLEKSGKLKAERTNSKIDEKIKFEECSSDQQSFLKLEDTTDNIVVKVEKIEFEEYPIKSANKEFYISDGNIETEEKTNILDQIPQSLQCTINTSIKLESCHEIGKIEEKIEDMGKMENFTQFNLDTDDKSFYETIKPDLSEKKSTQNSNLQEQKFLEKIEYVEMNEMNIKFSKTDNKPEFKKYEEDYPDYMGVQINIPYKESNWI